MVRGGAWGGGGGQLRGVLMGFAAFIKLEKQTKAQKKRKKAKAASVHHQFQSIPFDETPVQL